MEAHEMLQHCYTHDKLPQSLEVTVDAGFDRAACISVIFLERKQTARSIGPGTAN